MEHSVTLAIAQGLGQGKVGQEADSGLFAPGSCLIR